MDSAQVEADVIQLASRVVEVTHAAPTVIENDPFKDQFVICRCYSAGVHAGFLVSQAGDTVLLKQSRRLWSWTANKGVALSGVAVHGLNAPESKVDSAITLIRLTGVIEVLQCSDESKDSILGADEYNG